MTTLADISVAVTPLFDARGRRMGEGFCAALMRALPQGTEIADINAAVDALIPVDATSVTVASIVGHVRVRVDARRPRPAATGTPAAPSDMAYWGTYGKPTADKPVAFAEAVRLRLCLRATGRAHLVEHEEATACALLQAAPPYRRRAAWLDYLRAIETSAPDAPMPIGGET